MTYYQVLRLANGSLFLSFHFNVINYLLYAELYNKKTGPDDPVNIQLTLTNTNIQRLSSEPINLLPVLSFILVEAVCTVGFLRSV